jgi:nucleotide-binding universal stress UspA family protein
MSKADREDAIRRIVVALDASPHSLAALRTAAELAARLNAELLGIYVQDINLLRVAELPFSREITIYSAAPREIDRRQMEQQLRSQARQARHALAEIAREAHVDWSFVIARGLIETELLSFAQESDLFLLGKSGWSRRRRLGSTARVIVRRAPTMTMIVQHDVHLAAPVGVIYDGTALARKALIAATRVLRRQEGFLVIIILAETVDQARKYQREISGWVRQQNLHIHYRWLVGMKVSRLLELIRSEHCGALVVPAELEEWDGEELNKLVDQMECPVLLVR